MKIRLIEYWYLKIFINMVMYLVNYKVLLSYIFLIVYNYKINIFFFLLCVILSYVIFYKNKINEFVVIYDIVFIILNNVDFNL